ncbi:MAG: DUF4190 domain-containing protein [Beutenbergiaceae bacterium]
MSYPSAPPPSDGVNPYQDALEDAPPPSGERAWDSPAGTSAQPAPYGTPPVAPGGYAPPGPPGPPGGYAPPGPPGGYGPPGPGPAGYGPAGYGPPSYQAGYAWAASTQENGKGTASLVLGCVALFLCYIPIVSTACAVLAVVFGRRGQRAAQQGRANNQGLATAGLVVGIVGIVATVSLLLSTVSSLLGVL